MPLFRSRSRRPPLVASRDIARKQSQNKLTFPRLFSTYHPLCRFSPPRRRHRSNPLASQPFSRRIHRIIRRNLTLGVTRYSRHSVRILHDGEKFGENNRSDVVREDSRQGFDKSVSKVIFIAFKLNKVSTSNIVIQEKYGNVNTRVMYNISLKGRAKLGARVSAYQRD